MVVFCIAYLRSNILYSIHLSPIFIMVTMVDRTCLNEIFQLIELYPDNPDFVITRATMKQWFDKIRQIKLHGRKYNIYSDLFGSTVRQHGRIILNGTPNIWEETNMMTSSNGNIFRVTGHLCGEFTGPRWIPNTKTSDAELWCFLWSTPE